MCGNNSNHVIPSTIQIAKICVTVTVLHNPLADSMVVHHRIIFYGVD